MVLANLSIPKAIRKFSSEALASVMKSINQLYDKGVWHPVKYEEILDKKKIIRSLIVKREGTSRIVSWPMGECKTETTAKTYPHRRY